MAEESSYSMDWFKKAKEDLRRVKRRIDEEDLADAAFISSRRLRSI